MEKTDIVFDVEKLVDRHGLTDVFAALEQMCYEKADHLNANWQDREAAKQWDRVARHIEKLISNVDKLGL